MSRRETYVVQTRICAETWNDLKSGIQQAASWGNGSDVFVYAESLYECSLSQLPMDKVAEPRMAFEGRLFDAAIEARWRRLQDGRWAAWIIREAESEGARVQRIDRRYYLRGIRDKDRDTFHEARYPRKLFTYPVENAGHPDRAYVIVAEYWRTEPDWENETYEAASAALAQPLLCAHRFVEVNAGRDSQQGDEHADR